MHQLVTQQMPSHAHTQTTAVSTGGHGSQYANVGDGQFSAAGDTASTGGGQAHPNLPPTLVVNCVIKT